jgi:hypothetical protein
MKTSSSYDSKAIAVAAAALMTGLLSTSEVQAGHGAAWAVGGLLAGHVLTQRRDEEQEQTRALQSMAYDQPRTAAAPVQTAPAPAPATSMTPEQKIKQLDKLAAGGYITPAEYKAKKKAILDEL